MFDAKGSGTILTAYHCHYMLLSSFQLYPWWSPFFSACSIWMAHWLQAADGIVDRLYLPLDFLHWWIPPWPPDGLLTSLLMFIIIVGCQCYVAIELFRWFFVLVASSFTYALLVARRLMALSRDLIAKRVILSLIRFKSIRECHFGTGHCLILLRGRCRGVLKEHHRRVLVDFLRKSVTKSMGSP